MCFFFSLRSCGKTRVVGVRKASKWARMCCSGTRTRWRMLLGLPRTTKTGKIFGRTTVVVHGPQHVKFSSVDQVQWSERMFTSNITKETHGITFYPPVKVATRTMIRHMDAGPCGAAQRKTPWLWRHLRKTVVSSEMRRISDSKPKSASSVIIYSSDFPRLPRSL